MARASRSPLLRQGGRLISLSDLLTTAKKGQAPSLVRDTPVVTDWNGDDFYDLVVAHGQSDEILILLGGKDGLSKDRVQRIQLEYRVHYEHGVYVGDFKRRRQERSRGVRLHEHRRRRQRPPAVYIWLQ